MGTGSSINLLMTVQEMTGKATGWAVMLAIVQYVCVCNSARHIQNVTTYQDL